MADVSKNGQPEATGGHSSMPALLSNTQPAPEERSGNSVKPDSTTSHQQSQCLTRPGPHNTPDSARAWTVAGGSFLAGMALMGQIYSGGIFVVPLMKEYSSKLSETSLVVTMALVMFYVGGLFASHLADHFGVRAVSTAGSVIWTVGWLLGSFSGALWQSICTQGLLCGTGASLVYWPILSSLPQWFRKYRASAMGFAVLGSGVGSIAISFGGQQMITQLGWRNSLRIIGCIGSACLFLAVVLVDRRVAAAKHARGAFRGFFETAKDLIKLRNAQWFLASVAFFQFSFFVPYTFLASYAAHLNLPASFGGFALAMLGVGSAVGRLIFGPLADKFGRFLVYRLNVLFDVIVLAVWPACTTEPSITAFAFFYGLCGGSFAALFSVVGAELFGLERLSSFFTLVNIVSIPGAFAAGPAVGAIIQATGTFDAAIGFTAGMMGISLLLILMVKGSEKPQPLSPKQQQAHQAHEPTPLISTSPNDSPQQLETLSPAESDDAAPAHLRGLALVDDLEANMHFANEKQQDYLQSLLKYNVDVDQLKHATDDERQQYIRAVQLSTFREQFPDPPSDVFTRALNALRENSFEQLKQKVQEKFGTIPDEWEYQDMALI